MSTRLMLGASDRRAIAFDRLVQFTRTRLQHQPTRRLGGDCCRKVPEASWSLRPRPGMRRPNSSVRAYGRGLAKREFQMGSAARRQSEGSSGGSEIPPLDRAKFACVGRPAKARGPLRNSRAPERGRVSRRDCGDIKAVFPVCFVFQKPRKGQGRIQHEITHRR